MGRIGTRSSACMRSPEKSCPRQRKAPATQCLRSTVRAKKFLSLYPYSGAVIASVLEALSDFETTSGSIHYSADHQLPDAIVRRIVEARRAEIDATAR